MGSDPECFSSDFQRFTRPRLRIISQAGRTGWQILRQKPQVFHCFEHAAFDQVMVRKAGLGTAQAGVIGAGLARLAVP